MQHGPAARTSNSTSKRQDSNFSKPGESNKSSKSGFPRSALKQVSENIWEVPTSYRQGMRVPARVFSSEDMIDDVLNDRSVSQLVNVATLPGIRRYALAMPDIHEGYGFPIGGVGAFGVDDGVISPGAVGFDINCGIRLLRSELEFADIKDNVKELMVSIAREVPSGVGRGGRLRLTDEEVDAVLTDGAEEIVKRGYGKPEDLEGIESGGRLDEADPQTVSPRARKRGRDQVGTLGAGNHFVDVLVVDEVFDRKVAENMGLFKEQTVVLIHTGSRGLGHQIATDYSREMVSVMRKYDIQVSDRQLACAPFQSEEGQGYFRAMCAGANYAWANRQMITWEVREAWNNILGTRGSLGVVYDVSHNIAKVEEHHTGSKKEAVIVQRKGATRSFPGQPVLIPGSMGTRSFVLVGQEGAMTETFGSTCHGAGRKMSRSQAKREVQGEVLRKELEEQGIYLQAGSFGLIAEESPQAYKDVEGVVNVVHNVGIATKVVALRPIGVMIG